MEENLETPLSARQLAQRAGISVRALGRILRDRVGESPMRYYLKVRLQAARNALSDARRGDILVLLALTHRAEILEEVHRFIDG